MSKKGFVEKNHISGLETRKIGFLWRKLLIHVKKIFFATWYCDGIIFCVFGPADIEFWAAKHRNSLQFHLQPDFYRHFTKMGFLCQKLICARKGIFFRSFLNIIL